jgi:hypothetical protein
MITISKLRLNMQPMDTVPYSEDEGLANGIILFEKRGQPLGVQDWVLIGDDLCGFQSHGCSCCAEYWSGLLDQYKGWAWVIEPESRGH